MPKTQIDAMIQVDVLSAQTHLIELIQTVVAGERVVITHNNQPLAELVSLQPNQKNRVLGRGKGLVTLAPGFDEPLRDFKEYEG